MAMKTTAVCDVCSAEKRDVNHWWNAYEAATGGIMVTPFNENLARNEIVQSLCGQECVIAAVSKWMQSR